MKHFPSTKELYKILNKNTVELSYGCINKSKSIIK